MSTRAGMDVAVIGGGIIGLACAFELSRRGVRVVVFERDQPGSGAGLVAAGMLAPLSEADTTDPRLVELARMSAAGYADWIAAVETAAGMRCGHRTDGTLFIALDRDEAAELERLARLQRRLGHAAETLSREDLLAREPLLSPHAVAGLAITGDHQVDPRRLTKALAAAITALGGRIVCGAEAQPVCREGRVVGAASAGLEVAADAVIIAAGAWSGVVWPAAAGALPLRPVKGQILRLRGAALVRHVVRTPAVYLVPREDGELVVGATVEEQGFDTRNTAWAVADLLREAWRAVPGSAELEVAEIGAGLRPALRDHLPAIGAAALPGLFLAGGHYRNGVLLAPVTATLLVERILTGREPALLAPFDPRRWHAPATSAVPA